MYLKVSDLANSAMARQCNMRLILKNEMTVLQTRCDNTTETAQTGLQILHHLTAFN